ncbi:MAG: hypothetical protein K2H01_08350 [Ruminococcus sp.]|nr:hypothetical protein [Ruminococcus sp.]
MTHEKKLNTKELIEILTAISIVSKRLASNLSRKAAMQRHSAEKEYGGVLHESVSASAGST